MVVEKTSRQALVEALRRPRYEVTPMEGVEEQVTEHVPKNVKLTVTALPHRSLDNTLQLAEQLSTRGYETSPHLSARLIRDVVHLKEILHRLREADIRDVFVVAGDSKEPAGEFSGAPELLEAMSHSGYNFGEIGIAGYPESHPILSDQTTIRAMYEKRAHATYIVSQICFDPEVTAEWIWCVRERGVNLPIHIGIPGKVSKRKLLRVSSNIGVGESADFLRNYGHWFLRLLTPSVHDPEDLAKALTSHLVNPHSKVAGFHIYTFNDIEKIEAWRQEILENAEHGPFV